MTSPILEERVTAVGRVPRQIMGRTGALFAVAQQAAAVEPLIAEFWEQGREQSCHAQRLIWTKAAGDGLLPPGIDLEWLIFTVGLLVAAETYLLSSRVTTWDLVDDEVWISTTLTRLLETASPG